MLLRNPARVRLALRTPLAPRPRAERIRWSSIALRHRRSRSPDPSTGRFARWKRTAVSLAHRRRGSATAHGYRRHRDRGIMGKPRRPCPPPVIWRRTLDGGARAGRPGHSASATWNLADARAYGEVPRSAGRNRRPTGAIPWDCRGRGSRIAGAGFGIAGYIDRLDISADGRSALVRDYKTGRVPKDDIVLDRRQGTAALPLRLRGEGRCWARKCPSRRRSSIRTRIGICGSTTRTPCSARSPATCGLRARQSSPPAAR